MLRPLAVVPIRLFVASAGSWRHVGLIGWFGVRGVGSLFYLMYALHEGVSAEFGRQLVDFMLITIAMSVVVHGITASVIMKRPATGVA